MSFVAAEPVSIAVNDLVFLFVAKLVSKFSTALLVAHVLIFALVVLFAMDARPIHRVHAVELGIVVLHVVERGSTVPRSRYGAAAVAKGTLDTIAVRVYMSQPFDRWSHHMLESALRSIKILRLLIIE